MNVVASVFEFMPLMYMCTGLLIAFIMYIVISVITKAYYDRKL
ncbi:hypothetical protein [Bifidobacterium breve]|nr:hypothetical protein [Bifidobacterium breve]AUD89293.1 Acetyltransferase [Bifidobacterium breve]